MKAPAWLRALLSRPPRAAPIAMLLAALLGLSAAEGRPALAADLAVGRLVVASRDLVDPNFRESVVLLLRYGSEGALGLIVNRPTALTLSALLPDLEGVDGRGDALWEGGPVLRTAFLFLVRTAPPPPNLDRVLGRTSFGTSAEDLERLLVAGVSEQDLRVYAGHAGWAPGQLEREIRLGGWTVLPATEEIVFSPAPERIWLDLQLLPGERIAGSRLPASEPGSGSVTHYPEPGPIDFRLPAEEHQDNSGGERR